MSRILKEFLPVAGGPVHRCTAAIAVTLLSFNGLLGAQTIAITGGTVYPVSGPKIEHGTVVIRDGRIAAVGADLPVPAGAEVVDATGRWVTPGLFHAATQLGLTEVGSVGATNEGSMEGAINAAFNVAEGINPEVVTIPIARLEGVTTAVTAPSGGLISGQAVLIDLLGNRIEALIDQSPVGMVINLNESSKSAGGGSRGGVLLRLRQLFADAQEYDRRKADFQKNQMQTLSAPAAQLEALGPVLRRELPVLAVANLKSDIQNAIRLARDYHLKMVLLAAIEAWQLGSELAAAGIPVTLNPINDIPDL